MSSPDLTPAWVILASAVPSGERKADGDRLLVSIERLHQLAMQTSADSVDAVVVSLATIELGRMVLAMVLISNPAELVRVARALEDVLVDQPAGARIVADRVFSARWDLDRPWFTPGPGYEQIAELQPKVLTLIRRLLEEEDVRLSQGTPAFPMHVPAPTAREFETGRLPPLRSRIGGSAKADQGSVVERVLPVGTIQEHDHVQIAIWYGTTRRAKMSEDLNLFYGSERSDSSTLSHGRCVVAVPREKKFTEIPRPKWWLFERSENPAKHVMLLAIQPLSEEGFIRSLQEEGSRTAFLFIHGYNVSFAEAARRTAQLAYDLQFSGIPLLFSWPATGTVKAYPADEASMEASVGPLATFLEQVCFQTGITQVHVVAHSMGARCLVRAMDALATRAARQVCRQFVLTAPDIDRDELRNVAPNLVGSAKRLTLYASSEDLAIKASRKFHAEPRAGESGAFVLVLPKVDTIDVSGISTGFVSHSYYGDNASVVTDLTSLLKLELPPQRRPRLEKIKNRQGEYWRFDP